MTTTATSEPGYLDLTLNLEAVRDAGRPSVGRGGRMFYSGPKAAYRKTLDNLLALQLGDHEVLLGAWLVTIEYVIKRPRSPAHPWPMGDVDNYEKPILDALTRTQRVWSDDHQVVGVHHAKRYARSGEKPHIRVTALWVGDAVELAEAHLDKTRTTLRTLNNKRS